MLSLTTAAASQIRHAAADAGSADWALRVAARRESDGTITFGMGFDEPREGDMPLQLQGVNLVIAPPSQPMLEDIVLDFVELEPGQFNFIFTPEAELAEGAEKPAKACGNGGCNGCST
jgi:iron-sulfur cluster assembly protein